MKKINFLIIALLSYALGSCSSGDSPLEITLSSSNLFVIPATATSCYAVNNAEGTNTIPTADVSASYFRIPSITFKRNDSGSNSVLHIALIRVTYSTGTGGQQICNTGGDGLAALYYDRSSSAPPLWWTDPTKDATVTGATFSTNCPLYCGGVDTSQPFSTSATVDVIGFERDASGNETPVKASAYLTITSPN